ncbi:MAG TPA: hypothetical protein VD835_01865, partial [Pyrinomonadaceae bacterium]|nr:hypothetical protein [Pyrinomonadaceae bacterium]
MSNDTIQGYRLSPQQKMIWQLQSSTSLPAVALHPSSPPFNSCVHAVVRVPDALHLPYLASALQRLIARHEILRTTFHLLPGMSFPLQVVLDHSAPLLSRLSLDPATAMATAAADTATPALTRAATPEHPTDLILARCRQHWRSASTATTRPGDTGTNEAVVVRACVVTLDAAQSWLVLSVPEMC